MGTLKEIEPLPAARGRLDAGKFGTLELQKIVDELAEGERRTLILLVDIAVALLSAGLFVDILKICAT